MAKILIVEDNLALQAMVARRLNREGFQVITASNGMQTIAIARAELPDLILLDIDLPMLNGWQVARRLRSIAETHAIPIIVLTGAVAPDTPQQIAEAECDEFEPKPINFPQLIAKIRWLVRPGHPNRLNSRSAGAD